MMSGSRNSSRSSLLFFDDEADEDLKIGDPVAVLQSSTIERLGCHIPVCIARALEDNPLANTNDKNENPPKGFDAFSRQYSKSQRHSNRSSDSHTCSITSDCFLGSESSTIRSDELPVPQMRFMVPGQYPLPLPCENRYHWSALLLVDISGFTKLSTLLDVESLTMIINRYFELLIDETQKFGGDVLKFAGDAFYAEWREEDADAMEDLADALSIAAQCGASIVKKFSKYEVPGILSNVASLDVHCGLGAGQIATLHVGNHVTRREFLFLGSPVDQVAAAISFAEKGQLAASPEAIALLNETCNIPDHIRLSPGPRVISYCNNSYFEVKALEEEELEERMTKPYQLTYLSPNIIESLQHQMSLYVHPSARKDYSTSEGRYHRKAIADAELRSVYTIFIKPEIASELTGDEELDYRLFSLLNDVMGVTLRVLDEFKGHLRQFIIDDKGVVLIATFGQRGAAFPNLVTEKGLPATIAIHEALKIDLDVNSCVGATFGKAYCGVVGGIHRHEFAILGPSVNLAARLMCSKDNRGILVDDTVRQMANQRFDFLSRAPVKAKGYCDLVPIFEPQSAIERQWSKINYFVGREEEVSKLVRIGRRQLLGHQTRAHFVFIQAHSGLGKSSLAMHAMAMLSRVGVQHKKSVTIKKNVCKDGEQHIPFCVFRQLLLDILFEFCGDSGYDSDSSLSMNDFEEEHIPIHETDNSYLSGLRSWCIELNYDVQLADFIAEKVLGLHVTNCIGEQTEIKLQPDDVVDLIADIFLRRVFQDTFVLMALDDVQWMDSLSWNIVQRIVESATNCMVMCLSRPITQNSLCNDEGFLTFLRNETEVGAKESQFTELFLSPFSKQDVLKLLAAAFECEASCVNEQVCDYLYETTGGMPYFVQEVIGELIRNELLEYRDDGVYWRSGVNKADVLYSNVNELLLSRLDDFKSYGRTLLQVCAVVGFEFSLSELLLVQSRGKKRKSKQLEKIQEVLNKADKERILVEISQGGSILQKKTVDSGTGEHSTQEIEIPERYYTFTHSIWWQCVLGTMLEERKRDMHRSIARILESQGYSEVVELGSSMKLFRHWKDAGDLMKASELAQRIGKYFDGLLLNRQSLDVCLEAIKMWKDKGRAEGNENTFAGVSSKLLNSITPEELECLARLHIAVARIGDGKKTRIYYKKCHSILMNSSAAADLTDRSVFFAVYSGLFILIKNGLIDDDEFTVQDLAMGFVEQAQIHGDPVHIARALAMQSLTFAGLGMFEEAINIQKKLEKVYIPEKLSSGICREYATDRAAQSYGYSVVWYKLLGRNEECEQQIDFILNELMPVMPPKNVHNSIIILCPLLWVLLEKGEARKAEDLFATYVYDRFFAFYGENSTTFFSPMYKSLHALFRLAGDAQDNNFENGNINKHDYENIESWILSIDFGEIKGYISKTMRPYGRCPHSIFAEICWLLSLANKHWDEGRRRSLLEKGFRQAQLAYLHTKGNPGLKYAYIQSNKILHKFPAEMFEISDPVAESSQQAWEILGQNENSGTAVNPNTKTMVACIAAILEQRLTLALASEVGQSRLSFESKIELMMYVAHIESLYNNVEYHSFKHASHVVISMNKLIGMLASPKTTTSDCTSDPFTHFLCVFMALIHDVAHTGRSNQILTDQKHDIAVQYDNESMAERLSIDVAIEVLFRDEFQNLREAMFPTLKHKVMFGKVIYSAILCTDIACQDRVKMCKARYDIIFPPTGKKNNTEHGFEALDPRLCPIVPFLEEMYRVLDLSENELKRNGLEFAITRECLTNAVILEHLIQTADVAHTMQSWENFVKWNFRLFKELMVCSSQDFIPNPSRGWPAGQIGFFDNYVIPLAKRTERCCGAAAGFAKLANFAESNRNRWRKEGEKITDFFITGYENGETEEEVLRKCFHGD